MGTLVLTSLLEDLGNVRLPLARSLQETPRPHGTCHDWLAEYTDDRQVLRNHTATLALAVLIAHVTQIELSDLKAQVSAVQELRSNRQRLWRLLWPVALPRGAAAPSADACTTHQR